MPDTTQEYDIIIDTCRDIFIKKMQDYGTAWRILRPTSTQTKFSLKPIVSEALKKKAPAK